MLANNNVPKIELSAALLLFSTDIILQSLALQISVLNTPLVPHVAVPPPLNPVTQVTVVVEPVVPVMAPTVDRSEFVTSVAVHVLAAQVIKLNVPPVPQVAVNVLVPSYPVSQVTVLLEPIVPVIAPVVDLSEFATCVGVHASGVEETQVP